METILEMNSNKENVTTNNANENENDANHMEPIKQDVYYNNISNAEQEEGENNQLEIDNKENNVITNKVNGTEVTSNGNNVEMINENNSNINNDGQEKKKTNENSEKPAKEITVINNNIVTETEGNAQNNNTLRKLLITLGVILLITAITLFALKFKIWICVSALITGGSTGTIGFDLNKIMPYLNKIITRLKRFFGMQISYTHGVKAIIITKKQFRNEQQA